MPEPQGWTPVDEGASAWTPVPEPKTGRPATSGSMALDFMQGGGAELIGTALGAYNLLRKIPGADKVLPPVSPEVQQYAEPPKTAAAKIGKLFTQAGEFAVPAGEVGAATKGAGLLARAGAQAATAGAVQGIKSGGDIPSAADAAALGAAGPVAGAALGAGARAVAPILAKAPGVAADVVGLASPRAAHAIRVAQRIAQAAGKAAPAAEEAAPAAAAAAAAGPTEDEQMLDAIKRGQANAAEQANVPPKAYTPRPPDHYGVKQAEVPPESQTLQNSPIESNAAPAPEPEAPPQPKLASKAETAIGKNANAKADRVVGAIRQFGDEWNGAHPEQPFTTDSLAGYTQSQQAELVMRLKGLGYLKNSEKFPNLSWPYIVTKLKQAEYASR